MNRIHDILNQTDRIPELPEAAQLLLKQLSKGPFDQTQIVRLIESNPDSLHYVMRIDRALQPMNFDPARTLCWIGDIGPTFWR